MASIEVLTLVNPRSASLNPMPRGGSPRITKQMVNAALGKMEDHISTYIRVKYTYSTQEQAKALQWRKDPKSQPGVLEYLRNRLEQKLNDCNWPVDKQKKLIELAAISDIMPNICPICQGTRYELTKDKKNRDCELCDGTGRVRVTQEMCANYIGLSDARSFRRHWKDNYYFTLQILSEWEWIARRIIKHEI